MNISFKLFFNFMLKIIIYIYYEINSTSLKIAKIIVSGKSAKEGINKLKLNKVQEQTAHRNMGTLNMLKPIL